MYFQTKFQEGLIEMQTNKQNNPKFIISAKLWWSRIGANFIICII